MKPRKDTEAAYEADASQDDCPGCKNPAPQIRSAHQLALARQGGIDLLKPHLYRHFAQTPRITTDERRDAVESACAWVAGLMQMWSGFADETTGAPLPWWESRRQMIGREQAIAEGAYQQAPDVFKYPPAPSFSRGTAPVEPVYLREPGEDDVDADEGDDAAA